MRFKLPTTDEEARTRAEALTQDEAEEHLRIVEDALTGWRPREGTERMNVERWARALRARCMLP